MFDPEKVERDNRQSLGTEEEIECTVLASDYDQLLELYRGLLRQWNQGLNDSRYAADVNLRR